MARPGSDPSGGDDTSDTSESQDQDAFDRDLSGNIPTSDPEPATSTTSVEPSYSFDQNTSQTGGGGGPAPAPDPSPAPSSDPSPGSSSSSPSSGGGGGGVPQSIEEEIAQRSNQGARGGSSGNQQAGAEREAPSTETPTGGRPDVGGPSPGPMDTGDRSAGAQPGAPGVNRPQTAPGRGGPANAPSAGYGGSTQRPPAGSGQVPTGQDLDVMMAQRGEMEPANTGGPPAGGNDGFQQGVETQANPVGEQARGFEQELAAEYGVSPENISIGIEGNTLTAEFSEAATRETVNRAVSRPGTSNRAAAVGSQLDAQFAGDFRDDLPGAEQKQAAVDQQLDAEMAGEFAEYKQRGRTGVGGRYPADLIESELDAKSESADYDVTAEPGGGYSIEQVDRFDRDWSALNDRAESLLGVDVPFGGDPTVDEVERFWDETVAEEGGAFVSQFTSPLIERLESEAEADPSTPAVPLGEGFAYRPLGTDPEYLNLLSGPVKEVEELPQIPSMLLEATEGGAYIADPAADAAVDSVGAFYTGDLDRAMQRGRTAGRVLSERGDFGLAIGQEVGERALEDIEENPLEFTGTVLTGAAIGIGASSAIRRGVTRGADVDAPSPANSPAPIGSGLSGATPDIRGAVAGFGERLPSIRVVRDADRGLLDVDPAAISQVRNAPRNAAGSLSQSVKQPLGRANARAELDLRGTAAAVREADVNDLFEYGKRQAARARPPADDLAAQIQQANARAELDLRGLYGAATDPDYYTQPAVRAAGGVRQRAQSLSDDLSRLNARAELNLRGATGAFQEGDFFDIDTPSLRPDVSRLTDPLARANAQAELNLRGATGAFQEGDFFDIDTPSLRPGVSRLTDPLAGANARAELTLRGAVGAIQQFEAGDLRPSPAFAFDRPRPVEAARNLGDELTLEVRPGRPPKQRDIVLDVDDLDDFDIELGDGAPLRQAEGDAEADAGFDKNDAAETGGAGMLQIRQQVLRQTDADSGVRHEVDLAPSAQFKSGAGLGAGLSAGSSVFADAAGEDFLYEDMAGGGELNDELAGTGSFEGMGGTEDLDRAFGLDTPGEGLGVGQTQSVAQPTIESEMEAGFPTMTTAQPYDYSYSTGRPRPTPTPSAPFPQGDDLDREFGLGVESNSEVFSSGIQDVTDENIDDLLGGTGGSDNLDEQFFSG